MRVVLLLHQELHHYLSAVVSWSTLSKDGCHSCCLHNIRSSEFLQFFAPLRYERLVSCGFYGLFGCLGRGLEERTHIAIAAAIGVTGIASLLPSPRAIARISRPPIAHPSAAQPRAPQARTLRPARLSPRQPPL